MAFGTSVPAGLQAGPATMTATIIAMGLRLGTDRTGRKSDIEELQKQCNLAIPQMQAGSNIN
jgi:hypothetical protein